VYMTGFGEQLAQARTGVGAGSEQVSHGGPLHAGG
jgi:hypothetical protein